MTRMADMPNVDVNTDDLNEFELLLSGKAAPVVDEAPEEEVEEEEVEEEILADDPGAQDEQEEDDSDEEEADPEEEPEPEPQPKKKPSVQDRINELTREKYEEKRRADELERRLAALEVRQKPEPEPEKPSRPAFDPDAPTPDDKLPDGSDKYPLGEFDPHFVADLTKYTIRLENEAYKQELAQAEAAKAQAAKEEQLFNEWEAKLAKSEEELDDLRPTIAKLDTEFGSLEPQYGTYLAQTIMGMEYGPEVLYYLANNIAEARKIVAAGPAGATLSLGKIEARIQSALSKPATPTPRRTQAPKPPVSNRGNVGRNSVSPDTDNLDDFEALLFNRK